MPSMSGGDFRPPTNLARAAMVSTSTRCWPRSSACASFVPADAFTAETLGTERGGNGIVIDDGLILTIGYLITEADQVWLHLSDGRMMEGPRSASTPSAASAWCRRSAVSTSIRCRSGRPQRRRSATAS